MEESELEQLIAVLCEAEYSYEEGSAAAINACTGLLFEYRTNSNVYADDSGRAYHEGELIATLHYTRMGVWQWRPVGYYLNRMTGKGARS
jgi:hypothetical protein